MMKEQCNKEEQQGKMRHEITDLESCKAIAESFLELDLVPDPKFGDLMIHHPYFSSPVTMDSNGNLCSIVDDPHILAEAKQQIKERIKNVKSYQDFSQILNKPYLLAFLKYTQSYISKEDLSRFLSETWERVEFPNFDATLTKSQAVILFRKCDPEVMMDENELLTFENLPDKINVYRGVKKGLDHKALSWTLNKDVAKWFSLRFSDEGVVYKAEIKKEDVFAVFLNRGEQEIVLNYKKLENVRALKQDRRRQNDLTR